MQHNRTDDPRLGSLFVDKEDVKVDECDNMIKVALIGYSVDEGVARNGGRVGAKNGPEVVLNMIKKKGCVVNEEYGISLNDIKIVYYGNTEYCGDLRATHKNHELLVNRALNEGYLPIIIGGGNDQSYPNYCGLSNYLGNKFARLLVVNIDAHLDVRPLLSGNEPHSGSPFRQMLEAKHQQEVDFVEFACQGSQCSKDHVSYIKERGGKIVWLNHLHAPNQYNDTINQFRQLLSSSNTNSETAAFISFDIDSIRVADCPGVSCPGSLGLSAEEAVGICFEAGSYNCVKMLDISEFNPKVEEHITALLLVNMIYYFLMGLASRK